MQNPNQLKVLEKARSLAVDVLKLSMEKPLADHHSLADQIKRSSFSVASNIAEGCGRGGSKEFSRYLDISYGSLCELETQLHIIGEVFTNHLFTISRIQSKSTEVGKMLNALQQTLLKTRD